MPGSDRDRPLRRLTRQAPLAALHLHLRCPTQLSALQKLLCCYRSLARRRVGTGVEADVEG